MASYEVTDEVMIDAPPATVWAALHAEFQRETDWWMPYWRAQPRGEIPPGALGAEYAIVVADPWQGQGLGSKMTDYILEIAQERGIRKIYASVLSNNEGMIGIFERKGFSFRQEGYEAYYVELDLEKQTS